MVEIPATIEDHILQSELAGLARDSAANQLALLRLRHLLGGDILVLGRSGGQRLRTVVVDQLHIDIGIAPEHRQTWALGSPGNLLADAEFNFLSSECFRNHDVLFFCPDSGKDVPIPSQTARTRFPKLFTSSLTSLLPYHFTDITDTFALVRLGFTQAADLRGNSTDQLFVRPFQRDLGILPFVLFRCKLQLLGDLEDDVVRVAKRQVQEIALVGSFETHTDQFQLPFVPVRNSLYHIGSQAVIQTMQRPVTDLIGRPADLQASFLHFDFDIPVDRLFQFALRAFYGHHVITTYGHRHALGKNDRLFTYTRHNNFNLILSDILFLVAGRSACIGRA